MSLMREKRGAVKRAQLSIFMILGVLLLLAGIVWFAIINATERESPVPREAAPLNAFITACVKDAGDAAMRQIGYTGGYADIPQSIAADSTSYLRAGPIDSLRQPYWWHDGVSSVPPLDFIREEAERMAAREFASCIDNLSAFRQTYNIAALREPIARVSFNEKDVSVSMNYPVHAATKDNATTFSQDSFEASLPIRFTRIYGLATTLMEREDKDAFIEHRTIDLMAMDENTIPLSGMEFDCSPRVWQQDAVRQRIQELMSVNLPFIKVQGTPYSTTQYVPQPEGEKETFGNSYYAQHYLWDLGAGEFGGLRTAFTYDPRWPMVFNARPGSNGLLKAEPQQGADILSKICLNIYHFTYDLSFPIKVDVIDDTPQQPYVFSFAFKASIDHNQPSRGNTGYALFDQEDTIVSDEYCANKDVEATVLTVDNATGDPVKGVNLTFVCGRYSCDMGQTEWFGFGAAAGIVERFPRCVNGVLKAKAGGYLGSSQFHDAGVPHPHEGDQRHQGSEAPALQSRAGAAAQRERDGLHRPRREGQRVQVLHALPFLRHPAPAVPHGHPAHVSCLHPPPHRRGSHRRLRGGLDAIPGPAAGGGKHHPPRRPAGHGDRRGAVRLHERSGNALRKGAIAAAHVIIQAKPKPTPKSTSTSTSTSTPTP